MANAKHNKPKRNFKKPYVPKGRVRLGVAKSGGTPAERKRAARRTKWETIAKFMHKRGIGKDKSIQYLAADLSLAAMRQGVK